MIHVSRIGHGGAFELTHVIENLISVLGHHGGVPHIDFILELGSNFGQKSLAFSFIGRVHCEPVVWVQHQRRFRKGACQFV